MKTIFFNVIFLATLLLMQSCATSNVAYKSSKTLASTTEKKSKRSLAPSLAESYDFDSSDFDSDEYIKRRGKKARGTNDF